MSPNRTPTRFAHSEGHTHVCYDESGRYLLTGGSDGDVRVWEGIDDDDNQSIRVGDRVLALAFKKGRFFTSSDSNSVQAHTFPDGLPDGVYAKFTAPASQICFNVNGTTLAAGAEDFSIQIVNVETFGRMVCSGHEAPVLSVSLDPKDEFLASSSCDGSVKVWKISGDVEVEKSWEILPQCNDISLSKTLCRLSWETTSGKHLLIPVGKTIHVYERDTWNKVCELTDSCVTQTISILSFSEDGQHLAAACTNGQILIFDWKSKKCVQKLKHEKDVAITSIAWNPSGNNEIAYCDNLGQLGIFKDVLSQPVQSQSNKVPESTDSIMTMNDIFDDGDDDMLLTAGDDVDSEEDISKIKKKVSQMVTGNSTGITSDEDSLPFPGSIDGDAKSDSESVVEALQPVIEKTKSTPLQGPFQPGSTPLHLTSRYMKWNSVGVIKQYSSDEENSIDIEFHDSSLHHAMHLSNSYNYTMADMSNEAIIFASPADDDSPSKFTCMHFGSWDNAKEWSIAMPDGEDIMAITLGLGWLAIVTDQRNVRLFSIGGVQKQLFSIPGPIVSTSAQGNQLMLVYHSAAGVLGDQCLGVTLMYVTGQRKAVFNGELFPLSPKAMLSWIGFSAEGTPFYMDSEGLIRMLNRKLGPSWTQVLNTKSHIKGKSDNYWIVSVNENPAQLRCIPCKGSKYPPTLPRPAIALLPFRLPFCEITNEKSQYEESLTRTTLFSNHFDHWSSQGYSFDPVFKAEALKPTQEALMKLFALSARQEREFRALEVCEMMEDQYTLQLAIKYASRLRHMNLAERISEVAQKKLEEANVDEQEDEEEAWYQPEVETRNVPTRTDTTNSNSAVDDGNDAEDEDIFDDDMEIEELDKPSGPRLKMNDSQAELGNSVLSTPTDSSQRKANPFKAASSQKSSGKGSQVFDSLPKNKPKQTTPAQPLKLAPSKTNISKSTQKKTTNLFKVKPKQEKEKEKEPEKKEVSDVQKVPTAFELFLSDSKDEVLTQNPDADEDEIIKLCTDKFRGLEKEDKQIFIQKAKAMKSDSESKKRKRNENSSGDAKGDENKKPKTLSENTTSKLSNFAFNKE